MIVVMMALAAILPAKGIKRRVIFSRNGMNDTFFQKGLKGTVDGYPVVLLCSAFFDVRVIECRPFAQKQLQHSAPATGEAQPVFF